MNPAPYSKFYAPNSLDEAVAQLSNLDGAGVAVAGATWVMRAPIRGEYEDLAFVSLANIVALTDITLSETKLEFGAMATHEALAQKIEGAADLNHLYAAATQSANASIRRTATIGGNIGATGFMASDILPALLVSDALLHMVSSKGVLRLPLADYIATRDKRPHDEIIHKIEIERGDFAASHQRLLMRKAGEYPVANLSMCLGFDDESSVQVARVAVGAVEASPRRWTRFEDAIVGQRPADLDAATLAQSLCDEFEGRDGGDAPGWYRTRMLKTLAARAFAACAVSRDV